MDLLAGQVQQLVGNALSQMGAGKVKTGASELLGASPEEIEAAARDFEAVFITQMMQHMFSGVETDQLFGGGHAEDTYRMMLFDEYGKVMAQSGGIGVAEQVQRELLRIQEI